MRTLESILKRRPVTDIDTGVKMYFNAINKWVFDDDKQSRDLMKKSLEEVHSIPWDSRTYYDRRNKQVADIIKSGHEILMTSSMQPFYSIIVYRDGKFYKYYASNRVREWKMSQWGGSKTLNVDGAHYYILPEGTLKMLNEFS